MPASYWRDRISSLIHRNELSHHGNMRGQQFIAQRGVLGVTAGEVPSQPGSE